MGIDKLSDEFYTINTNQSGPPISARHTLQPRLLRSNPNPNTFPKKQTRQRWTGPIYLPGHIYKLLSQEPNDALTNTMLNLFKSLSPQETCMKLILYII